MRIISANYRHHKAKNEIFKYFTSRMIRAVYKPLKVFSIIGGALSV